MSLSSLIPSYVLQCTVCLTKPPYVSDPGYVRLKGISRICERCIWAHWFWIETQGALVVRCVLCIHMVFLLSSLIPSYVLQRVVYPTKPPYVSVPGNVHLKGITCIWERCIQACYLWTIVKHRALLWSVVSCVHMVCLLFPPSFLCLAAHCLSHQTALCFGSWARPLEEQRSHL
jgi:hypothetical protein